MSSFRWYDKADIVAFSRHKGRLKAVMVMVWGIIDFYFRRPIMLSYRHAFHAGNHADMLKHFTLFPRPRIFQPQRQALLVYRYAHSGAGLYDLSGDEAQKVGEYKQGIALLEQAGAVPAELAEFIGRRNKIPPQDNLLLRARLAQGAHARQRQNAPL